MGRRECFGRFFPEDLFTFCSSTMIRSSSFVSKDSKRGSSVYVSLSCFDRTNESDNTSKEFLRGVDWTFGSAILKKGFSSSADTLSSNSAALSTAWSASFSSTSCLICSRNLRVPFLASRSSGFGSDWVDFWFCFCRFLRCCVIGMRVLTGDFLHRIRATDRGFLLGSVLNRVNREGLCG